MLQTGVCLQNRLNSSRDPFENEDVEVHMQDLPSRSLGSIRAVRKVTLCCCRVSLQCRYERNEDATVLFLFSLSVARLGHARNIFTLTLKTHEALLIFKMSAQRRLKKKNVLLEFFFFFQEQFISALPESVEQWSECLP